MIIYNITVNIDASVQLEWLNWMKEVHIPEVMQTGLFLENRVLRVLGDEDSGGFTYSIQYFCESMEKYNIYLEKFAKDLQLKHADKYKDKFVAFRTLLEQI